MAALVSLLVIITISLIVVRIGAISLWMTGLSKDLAVFQSQSAFSGVGFTTKESESVVRHPARRRIIRLLMLLGNAGIMSAIAGLILTFYRGTGKDVALRVFCVLAALVLLWIASRSKFLERIMTRIIKAALVRWTDLEVHDYARLLNVGKGYTIAELEVEADNWLCGKTLSELALNLEGVLVLGIAGSGGSYISTPSSSMTINCSDVLTCYGPEQILQKLSSRPAGAEGNLQHSDAVEYHETTKQKEKKT